MATPTADFYSAASGVTTLRGGRAAPPSGAAFTNVALLSQDIYIPTAAAGQSTVLDLHGSGALEPDRGYRYLGTLPTSGSYPNALAWDAFTQMRFNVQGYSASGFTVIKPWDRPTSTPFRETNWMGFTRSGASPRQAYLYTERILDMIVAWTAANFPQLSTTKRYCGGGSKGAWGTLTYAIRRPSMFAALYPSRPKWRWDSSGNSTRFMDWDSGEIVSATGAAPILVADDGGYSTQVHQDIISYVANAANQIPWIGWSVGRNDGYMPFQDHVDAVTALRAAGRGFAFAWNNGNHSTGDLIATHIQNSYSYGMFEVGKGYPIYTNSSRDQNPAVDLEGGINLGFSHRNVVESASSWSCQVTNILGATTVTVRPKSAVYTGPTTPQIINIPAGTWVAVTFT